MNFVKHLYVELWLVSRREYEGVVGGGEGQGGGG